MDFVTSADGTRIGYDTSGIGPPIVLLGGACYGAKAWAAVAGFLAPQRTVYAIDRRGRGVSGDAAEYRVQCEVDDVHAVLDRIGEPAELFGHSSGALLALRVAMTGSAPVRALTLYEPPIRVEGEHSDAAGMTARLGELLAGGDREGALTAFLVDAAGVDEQTMPAMHRTSFWPAAVNLAHTLPYDTQLQEESGLDGLAELDLPTLLLLGERSDDGMRRGVQALADTLPNCRLEVLPEQQHNALREAPDLLAARVLNSG